MKRYHNIVCTLIVGLATLVMATPAHADELSGGGYVAHGNQATTEQRDIHELWEIGNQAYAVEDYDKAIEMYNAIIDDGYESDMLYYNLGNAYFKRGQNNTDAQGKGFNSGELGRAILYYERALMLNPDMDDARYNLDLAYELTDAPEAVPVGFMTDLWRSMSGAASSNTWTIVSLVMLAVTLALVLVFLLVNSIVWRKVSFFVAIATLLLFIFATTFAITQRTVEQQDNRAIIVCNDTAAIHSEPSNKSTVLRTHSQGVAVEVIRSEDEWSEVKFADGEKGWIRTDYIEVI